MPESSTTPEGAHPDRIEDTIDELGLLSFAIDRLTNASVAFSRSLHGELYTSPVTVADWLNSLAMLAESTQAADRILARLSSGSENTHRFRDDWAHLMSSKRYIEAGRAALRSDDSPRDALYNAAENLRLASSILEKWNDKSREERPISPHFRIADNLFGTFYPSKNLVSARLQRSFGNTDLAADGGTSDEEVFEKCTTSRKLYLVGYYAGCLYPGLWSLKEYRRFETLMRRLIKGIPNDNHYRRSIEDRLDLARKSPVLCPRHG